MARQTTKSNRSRGRTSGGRTPARRGAKGGSPDGRSASQKPSKYRFAQNVGGEATAAEREYQEYATSYGGGTEREPDVLLDVPVVKVDSIHFELDDLDAHVALKAKVLDLVTLNVGVDVHLGRVCLDIKGVEAQALLKVRLDHVAAIVDRVLTTLDRNPELLESVGKSVEDVGSGAGKALDETGDAVEDVGEGAEGAVKDVGKGAGSAVQDVGKGAGQAVGDVGEGAGQAVGEIGEGAGQGVGQLGKDAGQAVGQVGEGAGQAVGQVGQGAGQAAGGLGQAAGQVTGGLLGGGGQGGGDQGQGGGQQGQGGGERGRGGGEQDAGGGRNGAAAPGASPGQLAKEVAKLLAKEVGAAASDEAKDLGLVAAKKTKELGERRRLRRAEKQNATEAATKLALEQGIDLASIEGSGADGRITVQDVRGAVAA